MNKKPATTEHRQKEDNLVERNEDLVAGVRVKMLEGGPNPAAAGARVHAHAQLPDSVVTLRTRLLLVLRCQFGVAYSAGRVLSQEAVSV